MRLTPKAESLRAPLKALLADAVDLIDPPEVPLEETQQTIRMTTADYPAILVVAPAFGVFGFGYVQRRRFFLDNPADPARKQG